MKRIFVGRRAAIIAVIAIMPLAIATAFAQAATASPAQASSTASMTAATSCTGQIPYAKSKSTATHSAHERGFYFTSKGHVCVGQANLRENFNDHKGLAERVRVLNASGKIIFHTFNNNGSGAGSGTLTFTTHVNRLFNVSKVRVCVALVNQSDHTVVDKVSLCKTLG